MKKGIALLLFFASSLNLSAQDSWNRLAGFDAVNAAVWMDASFTASYAITADRWIYRLQNGSDVWEPFENVPVFYNVGSIKASDVTSRIFCLTSTSGIAFTDNLGATWQNNNIATNGTSGTGALVLAYGLNGTTIVASTIGGVSGAIQNPLWISSDNGNNFSQVATLPFYPTGFHFSASDLYSNTSDGIFKTGNLTTWQQIAFAGLEVTDLEVQGATLFASIKEPNNSRVCKSTDSGQTWSQLVGIPPANDVSKLAYDASSDRLYATTTAGVFVYTLGNWTQISAQQQSHEVIVDTNGRALFSGVRVNGIQSVVNLSVSPVNQGLTLPPDLVSVTSDWQVYTGSSATSFLSKFDLVQQEWSSQPLFEELETTRLISMTRTHDGQCLIGGMHFLAKTTAPGIVTPLATSESAPLAPVYGILFPQRMFAGNDGSISMIQHTSQTDVDHTSDDGLNWSKLYELPGNPGLMSIETVRSGISAHYILGRSNMTAQNVVLYSPSVGQTWVALPNPGATIRQIFMDQTDVLYAVTASSVFKWNVSGQNWTALNLSLGADPNKDVEVTFDQEGRVHVLVCATTGSFSQEGLYISNDEGSAFTHYPFQSVGGQLLRLRHLGFDPDGTPLAVSRLAERDFENEGVYYFSDVPYLSNPANQQISFSMYPNPASDRVWFGQNQQVKFAIHSVSGQTVLEGNETSADVSSLSEGIYIVRFTVGSESKIAKLVISR